MVVKLKSILVEFSKLKAEIYLASLLALVVFSISKSVFFTLIVIPVFGILVDVLVGNVLSC